MGMKFSVEDGIFTIHVGGVIRMADLPQLGAKMTEYYGAPDAFEVLVLRLRLDNPKLLRSAFVIIGDGTAALQLARILRDAPSPKRRTFTSVEQARAWLLET